MCKSERKYNREIMRLNNYFDDLLLAVGIVMVLAWSSVLYML